MTTIEWAKQRIGQQIADPKGLYLGECVSFFKACCVDVLGMPYEDLFAPGGGAKNLWLQFTPALAKHFDKVSDPLPGDWAIYDGSYGDVALFMGGGQVIGQLGTPVFKPVAIRAVGSPLGYLRVKGANMAAQDTIVDPELAIKLCTYGLHRGTDPGFAPGVVGLPLWQAIDKVTASDEWKAIDAKFKAEPVAPSILAPAVLDPATKAEIDQTNSVVSQILSLLKKFLIGG